MLEELASDGVVNRRAEDRMKIEETAKLSWQLNGGKEVEVDIKDYSPGGMRITSTVDIPDNVRLRVRFDREEADEQVIVEAKAIWYSTDGDDVEAGVQFTDAESPRKVASFVRRQAEKELAEADEAEKPVMRPMYLCAGIALIGLLILWAV
ncbi:MAG: PilZ domain-containing protein [Planctomycetota bacterium]